MRKDTPVYILIEILLVCAIITVLLSTIRHVRGAELTMCAAYPLGKRQWWSYRLIEGKPCWYPGRQARPREELRWPTPAKGQPRDDAPPSRSTVVPVVAPVAAPPIHYTLSWDVLMRSTTLWFVPEPMNKWRMP